MTVVIAGYSDLIEHSSWFD